MIIEKEESLIHTGDLLLRGVIWKVVSDTGISFELLEDIIRGKKSIDMDISTKLSKFFSCAPERWFDIQEYHNRQKMEEEEY